MNSGTTQPVNYAAAGVDVAAGDELVDRIGPAVASTRRDGSRGDLGGFGGLFDLKAAGFTDPLLVGATDGVGTKLMIASAANRFDTIGIDLVAMCVNDLVVQGAEPLFFLDYYATGKLDPANAASVVEGIAEGCRMAGAALIGGETAEMPGLYAPNDFDLAGFAVGAVERDGLLPRGDIVEGDILLGLASAGLHSNGFSLVRKLVADSGHSYGDAAPFAPELSLGEALLTPTRIYVKPLLATIRDTRAIKALAHITGGGLTGNVPRVLPDNLSATIDLGAFEVPPVMKWLGNLGAMEDSDFTATFNCGVGMAVVVAEAEAEALTATLTAAGESVQPIGKVGARRDGPAVEYSGHLGIAR